VDSASVTVLVWSLNARCRLEDLGFGTMIKQRWVNSFASEQGQVVRYFKQSNEILGFHEMQKINWTKSVCYAEGSCTILLILYSVSSVRNYFGSLVNTWKVHVKKIGKASLNINGENFLGCLSKDFLLCTNIVLLQSLLCKISCQSVAFNSNINKKFIWCKLF
jgi:hypothetical protein